MGGEEGKKGKKEGKRGKEREKEGKKGEEEILHDKDAWAQSPCFDCEAY